jgi:hypothetical protein
MKLDSGSIATILCNEFRASLQEANDDETGLKHNHESSSATG